MWKLWEWRAKKWSSEKVLQYTKIINMIAFWAKEYHHPELKHLAPNTPLTAGQACKEMDVSQNSFFTYLRKNPVFAETYHSLKETRRERMRDLAENNVEKILSWELEVENKDLASISLKVLENTDKAWRKQEEEVKAFDVNVSLSLDELYSKFEELKTK